MWEVSQLPETSKCKFYDGNAEQLLKQNISVYKFIQLY